MWVRGLKPVSDICRRSATRSHPVWVRGLKLLNGHNLGVNLGKSHPVWVRGLKLSIAVILSPIATVAPRVGAWIETEVYAYGIERKKKVAPRVGAWIETEFHHAIRGRILRRTPCGCVD